MAAASSPLISALLRDSKLCLLFHGIHLSVYGLRTDMSMIFCFSPSRGSAALPLASSLPLYTLTHHHCLPIERSSYKAYVRTYNAGKRTHKKKLQMRTKLRTYEQTSIQLALTKTLRTCRHSPLYSILKLIPPPIAPLATIPLLVYDICIYLFKFDHHAERKD